LNRNDQFDQASNNSGSDQLDSDGSMSGSEFDQLSLEYLPNELMYNTQFKNSDVDMILNGEECNNKKMLFEFFRGITLCHQANVTRDVHSEKCTFTGVHNDELFTLDFC